MTKDDKSDLHKFNKYLDCFSRRHAALERRLVQEKGLSAVEIKELKKQKLALKDKITATKHELKLCK